MAKKASQDAKPRKLLGFRAGRNIHSEIDFLNKHYHTNNAVLFERLIHSEYLAVTSGSQPGQRQSSIDETAESRSMSNDKANTSAIREAINQAIESSDAIDRIRNSSKLTFLTAQYILRELLHYFPLTLKVSGSNSNIEAKAFDKLQDEFDEKAAKRYAIILSMIQDNEAGAILEKLSERIL